MKLLDSAFYSKYNTRTLEVPQGCAISEIYVFCPSEGTRKTLCVEALAGKRPVEVQLIGQKCFVAPVVIENDGVVLRLRGFAESAKS